jgi:hypothetical protein
MTKLTELSDGPTDHDKIDRMVLTGAASEAALFWKCNVLSACRIDAQQRGASARAAFRAFDTSLLGRSQEKGGCDKMGQRGF